MERKLTLIDEMILQKLIIHSTSGPYKESSRIYTKPNCEVEEFSRSGGNNIFNIGACSYSISGHKSLHKAKIGRFVSIAHGVSIFDGHHPIDSLSSSSFSYGPWFKENIPTHLKYAGTPPNFRSSYGQVIIGNDVWIGSNVTIKAGCSIGDGAVIASNSNIVKDVEPYDIVGGNPARKIKSRFSNKVKNSLMDIKFWNLNIRDIRTLDWQNIELCIEKLSDLKGISQADYKKAVIKDNQIVEV